MKTPSAPNLYPELPLVEEGPGPPEQNYRLQKISVIENTLINEINNRKSLYKKYKRGINITEGVDTTLISASIILAGLGITTPLILPLEILAVVCGSLGVCVKFIRRKLSSKTQKHFKIKTMAESKLNTIKNLISKALTDGQISENEFKLILDELEKYNKLKLDSKNLENSKNLEIKEEEKKKLIEQGRTEAMNAIQNSLKTS